MKALFQLPDSIERKVFRRSVLFFFLLTFLIYGRSIRNKFSMDDEYVTYKNEQIQGGIRSIPEIFTTTYATENNASFEYRPLVKVTFAIEYQFFGENPHISHFINILLYFLCCLLLFVLLLRLIPNVHFLFPFLVTLLFLIHPLHSEVVISLKNRDVLLSFLGVILSLIYFLRYVDGRSWINLFGGLFFFVFSLMSKKDSMTLFAFLPFTLWFFRKLSWRTLGTVMISILPATVIFRAAAKSVSNESVRILLQWENPLFIGSSFWERIPQGFYSIYFYLKMFVLPVPLISYYGYNQVPVVGWSHPVVWLMMLLIAAALYFSWRHLKDRKVWIFGIVFFLITISMFTNVVKPVVGIVAERFAFLPSVGLCIVAVWALLKAFGYDVHSADVVPPKTQTRVRIAFAGLVLLFGAQVFARCPDWASHYSLYKADVAKAPESAHLNTLMAAASIQEAKRNKRLTAEQKRKYIDDAVKHYQESIRIVPDYVSSHNNIGMVYFSFYNRPDLSMPHLKKAIALDTKYEEAYFNLATCEMAVGQLDSAEQHFRKCIELKPDFQAAYVSLSKVYIENKKYEELLEINLQAIERKIPGDMPFINAGNSWFLRGDTLKALPYLEKAISIHPDNRNLNAFLADFYSKKGVKEKADFYYSLQQQSSR
jgi:tetratricopeptide (TPR) repeat protein